MMNVSFLSAGEETALSVGVIVPDPARAEVNELPAEQRSRTRSGQPLLNISLTRSSWGGGGHRQRMMTYYCSPYSSRAQRGLVR